MSLTMRMYLKCAQHACMKHQPTNQNISKIKANNDSILI